MDLLDDKTAEPVEAEFEFQVIAEEIEARPGEWIEGVGEIRAEVVCTSGRLPCFGGNVAVTLGNQTGEALLTDVSPDCTTGRLIGVAGLEPPESTG